MRDLAIAQLLLAVSVGIALGVTATIAWGLLAGDLLTTWAGALRRIARCLGATRALVLIVTKRVAISKLPEEERRWFRRAVSQLVAAEGRIRGLQEANHASEEAIQVWEGRHSEAVRDRDVAVTAKAVVWEEREHQRVRANAAEAKVARIGEVMFADGVNADAAFTLVSRVLKCPQADPDHGLGACGCEVRT